MQRVRAAVIPEPGEPVELRDYPSPELEPGGALLRTQMSEVCGTDVYLQQGRLAETPYPLIPGHISVGALEAVRGVVCDIEGRRLREGDTVTFLDVHRTCHKCWYCLVAQASTRCPKRKVYGITYGADDNLAGGWAEVVYLKPETRILPLEAGLAERFMAGGCGLATALHAVDRAGIHIGDTVLVLGCGPVGLSATILGKMAGALDVLCIGAPDERLQTALRVGASATLNFLTLPVEERKAWVLKRTGGRGADVTIEATGAPEAVVEAMQFTRDGGRVVVVGQYTDHGTTGFNPHLDLNKKQLDLKGCWGSDFSHFYRAVRLISHPERSSEWAKIPLKRFSLQECNAALQAVSQGEVVKALVVP